MLNANIIVGNYKFKIDLHKTETARKIYENLPIYGVVNFWGDEVYFFTNLKMDLEDNARDVVKKGELAYWPNGDAIAIGFGQTPISIANEIRLADKCNIWGTTKFDLEKLKIIIPQEKIIISK